jgi:hypothetical protein
MSSTVPSIILVKLSIPSRRKPRAKPSYRLKRPRQSCSLCTFSPFLASFCPAHSLAHGSLLTSRRSTRLPLSISLQRAQPVRPSCSSSGFGSRRARPYSQAEQSQLPHQMLTSLDRPWTKLVRLLLLDRYSCGWQNPSLPFSRDFC